MRDLFTCATSFNGMTNASRAHALRSAKLTGGSPPA